MNTLGFRLAGQFAITAAFAIASVGVSREAHADRLMIDLPSVHPHYIFEAEPHVLIGAIEPPGPAEGQGFGLGFRGTFEVVDNGFINSINNTVGIGVGVDYIGYSWDTCESGTCRDEAAAYLWFPLVMQWNFWLSEQWSVFAEPGVGLRVDDEDGVSPEPIQMYLGGRWHFSEYVALTLRVGYPTFSVGSSFIF